MRILVIDNYDSFTYILSQYLAELSQTEPKVTLNDQITIAEIKAYNPTHIVISPGPGNPTNLNDFGIGYQIFQNYIGKIPILGICLGHQGLVHHFGGKITNAPQVRHGKQSLVNILPAQQNLSPSLFTGLPSQIQVMRYHSLIAKTVKAPLIVTATTNNNLIMAVQHNKYPVYGIQFHPESFGTEFGKEILKNFLQNN